MNNEYFNKVPLKSLTELYFSYYIDELVDAGFISQWWYEKDTFKLADSVHYHYEQYNKKATKVIEKKELLLRKASITADFTILWNDSSLNVFIRQLDVSNSPLVCKITDIPFKGNNWYSYIETKGEYEGNTSSSISFPYKQKWVYQLHNIYIQKIQPFILFEKTFTPTKVMKLSTYKRDGKYGKKGQSSLKYEPRTLKEYLDTKIII